MTTGPLAGIRVLDLTRLLPGALATQILADRGAEVIKIEPPGGDYARTLVPEMFAATNRGKTNIELNLKTTDGRATLLDMLPGARVLIESFRPGVLHRLGLDIPTLHAVNPSLVVASITGYGQSGPDRDRAGHDINYLAMSGVLDHIGPAHFPNLQLADIAGGAHQAVTEILAALIGGRGAHLDINMTAGVKALMPVPPFEKLNGAYPCYTTYECAGHSWIAVGALEPKFWHNLCDALDRPDLVPRHFDPAAKPELAAVFATRTAADWFAQLGHRDCCLTPVRPFERP